MCETPRKVRSGLWEAWFVESLGSGLVKPDEVANVV